MFMNLKGNWVVTKGIHPKEAPNAKREDVFEIVALCRKMDGQWGKYVLTTQLRKAIAKIKYNFLLVFPQNGFGHQFGFAPPRDREGYSRTGANSGLHHTLRWAGCTHTSSHLFALFCCWTFGLQLDAQYILESAEGSAH